MDARHRVLNVVRNLVGALVCSALISACSSEDNGDGDRSSVPRGQPAGERRPAQGRPPTAPPRVRPYEPADREVYPNAKRLAGKVVQRATTYGVGASARRVATTLPDSAVGADAVAAVIEPVVRPGHSSAGEVVYVQMSGVTPTTFGAMVAVRQTLRDANGRSRVVTRVFDVRLRRAGGPWKLDRIGSVGGREATRPDSLPAAADRVLDNPRIALFDSARWDIYRGDIDARLLDALDRASQDHALAVLTLRSGHPRNVWATERPSAHSKGLAADIYAVDERLVVSQREPGGAVSDLARTLLDGGAHQVGSPWVLPPGAPRSFSDEVHQDHLHLQQAAAR